MPNRNRKSFSNLISSKLIYHFTHCFLFSEQLVKKSACPEKDFPQQIRVSIGSGIVIGLLEGKLDVEPTTAYLMTYKVGKCTANCGFCPQARSSSSKANLLSRVSWPPFPTKSLLKIIWKSVDNGKIRRVCLQALNYPGVFLHLASLIKAIRHQAKVPISVSCQPLSSGNMKLMAEAGAERIGIAIDAVTENIFTQIKGSSANGPYIWDNQFRKLGQALEIFGKGKVSTHLIIGLGETESDAASLIQRCVDMCVSPALFAFTPVRGTALETKPSPLVESYRRIQLARYLIVNGHARSEDMHFDGSGCLIDYTVEKETLMRIVETGNPFLTSGCPNCNRPFYNEKPSGPIYNFPRNISQIEISAIKRQLSLKTIL